MASIRSLALGLAAGLLLGGCVPAPAPVAAPDATAPQPGYVRSVRADEVDLWRAMNDRSLVLDLRLPEEWNDALGHLEGAVQIPYADFDARVGEIATYRDRPVLVYHTDGPRAQAVAQSLSRQGYREVAWIDGGLKAYRAWLEAK